MINTAGQKRGASLAAGGARSDSSSGRSIQQKLDMSLEKIDPKAALPRSYKGGGKDAEATKDGDKDMETTSPKREIHQR